MQDDLSSRLEISPALDYGGSRSIVLTWGKNRLHKGRRAVGLPVGRRAVRFHRSRGWPKQETISSAPFPLISTLAGQTLMKNPRGGGGLCLRPPPFRPSACLLACSCRPNNILSSRRRRKSKSRLRDERKKRPNER